MIRQLSATKKVEYLPILYSRQGGKCLYCQERFDDFKDAVFDHLNNDRGDNRLENLCLVHQRCNIKKATNIDYQIIANEQLKKNEDAVLSERKKIEDATGLDAGTEININVNNYNIAEQFLRERIQADGSIEFSEALDSIVYLCKNRTGHGSHQAARNYLKTLVSPLAPFMISKDEKTRKKMIVRRSGQ